MDPVANGAKKQEPGVGSWKARLQDLTEKPSVGSTQGGVDKVQTEEDEEKKKKFTNGGVIYSNSRETVVK